MDLPPELDFERLSFEQKYHRAVPGYQRRLRLIYEAIQERFGEEGLAMIRDVSRAYGAEIAANVSKGGEVKGVLGVGRYLLKVFDMVSDRCTVTEFSDERLVISVDRCPYPFRSEALCAAHTCMERAIVTGLDENLDYRIGTSIPRGDACCEHILERKGT